MSYLKENLNVLKLNGIRYNLSNNIALRFERWKRNNRRI